MRPVRREGVRTLGCALQDASQGLGQIQEARIADGSPAASVAHHGQRRIMVGVGPAAGAAKPEMSEGAGQGVGANQTVICESPLLRTMITRSRRSFWISAGGSTVPGKSSRVSPRTPPPASMAYMAPRDTASKNPFTAGRLESRISGLWTHLFHAATTEDRGDAPRVDRGTRRRRQIRHRNASDTDGLVQRLAHCERQAQPAVTPWSLERMAPWMLPASSEARKANRAAMSSGCPGPRKPPYWTTRSSSMSAGI
jgi:hypothetical protein